MANDESELNMDSAHSDDGELTLKDLFDAHAEETISDEQIRRVLDPVLKMIKEGRFNRPRRVSWIVPLTAAAAVLVVTAAITMFRSGLINDAFVDLPDVDPPLIETIPVVKTLSGSVTFMSSGVSGVTIVLVDAESLEVVFSSITDSEGAYAFNNVPVGIYRLTAYPHPGMAIANDTDADGWIIVNGTIDLILGTGADGSFDYIDIEFENSD